MCRSLKDQRDNKKTMDGTKTNARKFEWNWNERISPGYLITFNSIWSRRQCLGCPFHQRLFRQCAILGKRRCCSDRWRLKSCRKTHFVDKYDRSRLHEVFSHTFAGPNSCYSFEPFGVGCRYRWLSVFLLIVISAELFSFSPTNSVCNHVSHHLTWQQPAFRTIMCEVFLHSWFNARKMSPSVEFFVERDRIFWSTCTV